MGITINRYGRVHLSEFKYNSQTINRRKMKIQLKQNMLCHMAFDTVHLMKYEYTIVCPDNLVDGRKFYSETRTPKRKGEMGKFGKAETVFYFNMESELFKSGEELLNSIGLTIK